MQSSNNVYDTNYYDTYTNLYPWDTCCECDKKFVKKKCNNCGFGICKQKQCSFQFAQYNNPDMVICKTCYDEIDEKLVPSINYNQLRLLKKKIEERVEKSVDKKIAETINREIITTYDT
jgi:hypothetical protein